MKTCSRCKKEKPRSEFNKGSGKKDGLSYWCRACNRANMKKYYQENKERFAARSAEERKKNPSKVAAYKRAWYERNKERLKQQRETKERKALDRKRRRERLKNDEIFSIKARVRRRVTKAIAAKGFRKNSKTEFLLGCSWDHLKDHIERQFLPGMTWDNRSEWHIDHVVPLASASTPEEVEALCHYTNLRPLWAKDNHSKHAKPEFLI